MARRRSAPHSSWTVGALADSVGGRVSPALARDTPIRNFFIRAWSCGRGSLFVPLLFQGAKQARKARAAVSRQNAVGALVDTQTGLSDELPHIWVPDLKAAALHLAKLSRDRFEGQLVGVTGSAGKTTTTAMIAACLAQHGATWKTRNNNNSTPEVTTNVIGLPAQGAYAAMELALSGVYRVSEAAGIARPHVGVITSIGRAHIDSFADDADPAQSVINEKLSIMDHVVPGGAVVLPSGSDHFDAMLDYARRSTHLKTIVTCGTRDADDIRLVRAESLELAERVTLAAGDDQVTVDVPFIGAHMHGNTLLAAGVLRALKLPVSSVSAIAGMKRTMSSLMVYEAEYGAKPVRIYNDSYNSTDKNVLALLEIAKARPGRKILILADIPKLAQLGKDVHRTLIPAIDAAGFAHIVTVGPHLKSLGPMFETPSSAFETRQDALAHAEDLLTAGDSLFIKGNPEGEFGDIMKLVEQSAKLERVSP